MTDMRIDDLTEYGRTLKARVLQDTGLPVSVCFAATKCLTKIDMEIVKHDPSYGGVLDLTRFSEQDQDALLTLGAIEDVWGIGHK